MKLELKHIAGYLPYELQISRDDKHFGRLHALYNKTNKAEIEFEFGYDRYLIKDLKPLLRPLADLIKPCLNSKIPLAELAKIEGSPSAFSKKQSVHEKYSSWIIASSLYDESLDVFGYDTRFGFLKHNTSTMDVHFVFNQVKMFEYLYANHFDIHGLIEQGLAIDVNTL